MIKSKHFRDAVAAWLLVLLCFAAGVQAEISPRSAGDELLQILPAESLFCVRVNNLDSTLSSMDQFLAGILPKSSEVSKLVRMQFAKVLGSPELNGVNMEGSFALFGVTSAGKPPGPKPSDMFIGALVPITDYKQFIDGNPNLSPPDANGVSKNTSSEFGGMLIKQVGNYALIGPSESGTFAATAKSISGGKSAKLGSVLDAAEAQQAMKEPLWMYGNIQQVSKTFGPLIFGKIEEMKKMMEGTGSKVQTRIDPFDMSECYLADLDADKYLTIDELDQQIKKSKIEMDKKERNVQAKIERLERRKTRLAETDADREAQLNAIKQQIEKLRKLKKDSKSNTQERIDRLERLKNKLARMGPDKKVKISELVRQTEDPSRKKEQPGDRQAPKSFENVMNMYAAIFETLMKETKSLSLTVRPSPNACNLTVSVSAVPGTEMANMFAADTSIVKENRLLGYLEDGAMMNFAGKMNTPFWKQLNLKSIDLLTAIAGEAMTAEDITKMKTLTADWISALGGPTAVSFSIDANSKPPFALKYVLEVKDADKFNKVIEEAMEMMNAGGIADFYKSLGIEMGFSIKRGVGSYKGVSIDSAKLVMKSTDPNLPQGQMIDAMYGDGFEYRWAIVDGLWVCTIGGDVDSAIRKLIDEVKAGEPEQMAAEMKAALTLLPEAGRAEFMGTYNFLRLFKMMGAMAGAFMPVPMPFAQMDIPTKSNIVFAGKAGNNRMTVEICLPKEHLTEIVSAFVQPALSRVRHITKRITSGTNLSAIGRALLIYANDYDQYPPNLQALVDKAELRPRCLESPLKPKGFDGPSYIYIAGQSTRTSEPGNILAYENPAFCSDKINILFNDAHVEAMKPAEFLKKLQATYKRLGREMPEIKFKDSTKPGL